MTIETVRPIQQVYNLLRGRVAIINDCADTKTSMAEMYCLVQGLIAVAAQDEML